MHTARNAASAGLALLLTACGNDVARTTTIAGSAFPPECLGPALNNESFYGHAEVEPFLAVDPLDPAHLITVWQQDRYSRGGSAGLLTGVSFDAGKTWETHSAPFSHCTGGTSSNGGDYERASDPWVTIAPDGTAHQQALTFDVSLAGGHRAILASRSTDGGRTWSAAKTLQGDFDSSFALDKGSITADPKDASHVYAVWDRLTVQNVPSSPSVHGPAWFARTTDGGATWEQARAIYDPGADAQTIGNVIAVLPDGTLLNAMTVFTDITKPTTAAKIAVLRSSDKGVTWPDPPVTVNVVANLPIVDPKTRVGVRSGGALPSIAVDASTGKVYVVWQDSRFTGLRNGVALATSTDGGLTWSPLVQVNSVPGTNAFTPAISAGGGRIAVSYYDFRFDVPSDSSQLQVNSWLATSTDDGATWQETALAGPFNLYTAPVAEGFFLGDYQGAAWDGAAFLSFFSATNSGNLADRTSLQFRRVEPGAPAAMHAWLDRIRPDRWLRSWLRPSERAGRPAAARTAR